MTLLSRLLNKWPLVWRSKYETVLDRCDRLGSLCESQTEVAWQAMRDVERWKHDEFERQIILERDEEIAKLKARIKVLEGADALVVTYSKEQGSFTVNGTVFERTESPFCNPYLQAIKEVRRLYEMPLKDAKRVVDDARNSAPIPEPKEVPLGICVGSIVEWDACAGGNNHSPLRGDGWLYHRGTVREVVPAGEIPKLVTWPCSPRKKVSYIVTENGHLFWPNAKSFRSFRAVEEGAAE